MWTPTPTTVLTKAHLKLRVRGCHDEAVILCIQGALWHILETKMSEVSSYGAGIKLSEMYSAHERRMTENICLCFSSFIIWSSISLLSWLLLPAPFFFSLPHTRSSSPVFPALSSHCSLTQLFQFLLSLSSGYTFHSPPIPLSAAPF